MNDLNHSFACEADCPQAELCPLSHVKAGTFVKIKRLSASEDVCTRLREMGLGEEQKIRLLSAKSNIICQVCNARLGISAQLAEQIFVEPVPVRRVA